VTFVFAVYCEPLTGAWILGALTAANLAWFHLGAGGRGGHAAAAMMGLVVLAFLIAAASPIRSAVETWSAGLRHRSYGEGFEWLAERNTPYQHLSLARRGEQFCLLSNGQFIATLPDPYAVRQRVHLMMSQCETARRVLVIGGGESGALTSLVRYPGLEIDYVEIDPQVLALVRPHLEEEDQRALDDPRVHIIHEDARRFVQRRLAEAGATSEPLYDAIFCNTPDPSTAALNRFYTAEFFGQARRLLGQSGVFVTAISSGLNYLDQELLYYVGSVYEVMEKSFGHVLVPPGVPVFLFATAQDDQLTSDVERLIARFERRGINAPGFSPLYFHTAYESDRLQLVNQTLRQAVGTMRPNTDFEPVTYLYYLRLWNRYSGGRSQVFFGLVARYDWRWVVWACIVAMVVRLATSRRWPMASDRAVYRQAVAALFLTGAAGMVSSIVLLLLFQNLYGSLYRDVGLLVALFMAGLTVGSALGNRIGRSERSSLVIFLFLSSLAYALFFLALEMLASAGATNRATAKLLDHAGFFYAAMILAGTLTGAPFPLVGRLAVVCGRDPGRAGGVLESLDHLGACLGAFLIGIVLVPVSGIVATLKVFGFIELFAAALLALTGILLVGVRKTPAPPQSDGHGTTEN
jgi:spermidine synthase